MTSDPYFVIDTSENGWTSAPGSSKAAVVVEGDLSHYRFPAETGNRIIEFSDADRMITITGNMGEVDLEGLAKALGIEGATVRIRFDYHSDFIDD